MTQVYNPQSGRCFEIEDILTETMAMHNFAPWHSGGGCFAWRRSFPNGTYDLITCEDCSLGTWDERHENLWIGNRHHEDCDEYIEVAEDTDLLNTISLFTLFEPNP